MACPRPSWLPHPRELVWPKPHITEGEGRATYTAKGSQASWPHPGWLSLCILVNAGGGGRGMGA